MAQALGPVLPGPKVFGWPASDPANSGRCQKYPLVSLEEALTTRWEYDAWFQPCNLVEDQAPDPSDEQYRLRKASAEGGAAVMTCIFLDFDLPDKRDWLSTAEEIARTKELFESTQRAHLPKPAVYSTTHGARLAWPLSKPVDGRLADDFIRQFRAWGKANKIGDEKGTLLWDDMAVGWVRGYRLPHIQRKSGYWTPNYHRLTDFEFLDWEPEEGLSESPLHKAGVVHDEAPDLRPLTPAEWLHIPEAHRARLQSGEALFPSGGRNAGTLNVLLPTLSSDIAEYAPPNPEIVYLAMAPGVIAQGEEPSLERLWTRTSQICANDSNEHSITEFYEYTTDAVVEKAIADHARALAKVNASAEEASESDKARLERAKARMAKEVKKMDSARKAAINQAKLDEAAKKAQDDPDKPYLVYSGDRSNAFILYSDGRYREKAKDVISILLEREHGIRLRTDKGASLKFGHVFDRMGADAHGVHMQYWLPGRTDRFCSKSQILHRVTQPPGQGLLEAKYHEEVAHWLDLLVPDADQNKLLLDWLAASLHLDKPIAALFLVGPKGTGKSMLGEALASFWGLKADYNKTVGANHNEIAAVTPVLLADEGIHMKRMDSVNQFKELITQRHTEINKKHKALYHMDGCPRIVISGNDLTAFSIPDGGGMDHVEAVAERLLYLECGQRDVVEAHLRAVGTEDQHWVRRPDNSPGKIAEHILWLHQNHKQTSPRGRLIVSGQVGGPWQAKKAASSSSLDGSVLIALAKWADKGIYVAGLSVEPQRYPGVILVNGSSLTDHWEDLTGDMRAPLIKSVSHALASCSVWPSPKVVQFQGKKRRCYAVPFGPVLEAANIACIGNDEDMLAWLEPASEATNRDNDVVEAPARQE